MKDEKVIAFVKLVVSTIQKNHRSQRECTKALTQILEEADKLHEELAGSRIVIKGNRDVLDALVSQPLAKI